jgi:hypothetical protein
VERRIVAATALGRCETGRSEVGRSAVVEVLQNAADVTLPMRSEAIYYLINAYLR